MTSVKEWRAIRFGALIGGDFGILAYISPTDDAESARRARRRSPERGRSRERRDRSRLPNSSQTMFRTAGTSSLMGGQ